MTYASLVVRGKDPYADGFMTKTLLNDLHSRQNAVLGTVRGVQFYVSKETTNVRDITIRLLDALGAPILARTPFTLGLLLDANGDAFVVTGGSTGLAVKSGSEAALLAQVAKKWFTVISDENGEAVLTWTDTGTEAAFPVVVLDDGTLVIGPALANA